MNTTIKPETLIDQLSELHGNSPHDLRPKTKELKITNTAIKSETLINQLNWRYATKQFDPNRKINVSDWATLEEAL
ncbi:MAG TPA: hypothetical protein VII71_05850, partial [Verrucomicrobiae bacterium]